MAQLTIPELETINFSQDFSQNNSAAKYV